LESYEGPPANETVRNLPTDRSERKPTDRSEAANDRLRECRFSVDWEKRH
jgi:hypothetical protein